MKHAAILLTLALATLAITALPSCTSAGSPDLTRLANVAIVSAQIGGAITPKQAALATEAGKLLLTPAESPEAKLAAVSEAVVTYAVANGDITPAQAEALRAAGEVPLATPPVALPPTQ